MGKDAWLKSYKRPGELGHRILAGERLGCWRLEAGNGTQKTQFDTQRFLVDFCGGAGDCRGGSMRGTTGSCGDSQRELGGEHGRRPVFPRDVVRGAFGDEPERGGGVVDAVERLGRGDTARDVVGPEDGEGLGRNVDGADSERRDVFWELECGPGGICGEDAGGDAEADAGEAGGGRVEEREASGVLVAGGTGRDGEAEVKYPL